jgi:hypothetical protein
VLHFIFDDDRYVAASDPPAKLFTAFLIILEFPVIVLLHLIIDGSIMIVKQSIIFIKYVLVLFIISVFCIMIYTNALFSFVIVAENLTDFVKISWTDAGFCVALLCSVVLLLPLYVLAVGISPMSRAFMPFRTARPEAPAAVKGERSGFRIRASTAVAVATVILFFLHWDIYGQYATLIRGYDATSGWALDVSASLACRLPRVTPRSRMRCLDRWGAAAANPNAANSKAPANPSAAASPNLNTGSVSAATVGGRK